MGINIDLDANVEVYEDIEIPHYTEYENRYMLFNLDFIEQDKASHDMRYNGFIDDQKVLLEEKNESNEMPEEILVKEVKVHVQEDQKENVKDFKEKTSQICPM